MTSMDALDLDAGVELLRALAQVVRLQLLRSLIEGERAVGDIEAVTGVGQPGLSQQLAILRKADLVETRREAKQVFYRINQQRFAELSSLIDAFAGTGPHRSAPAEAPRRRSVGGAAAFARVG